MKERQWFKAWFNSPFYHKLYFERDEHEARQFFEHLFTHLQPPAKSFMLQLDCGRGSYSRILAEKGFDVTGVDLSAENIVYAEQFRDDHLHFYQHDVRRPMWINYFDYVFSFFTSFGYYATQREHDDAVRTIATALKPGGVAVFDFLNVHYAESRLQSHETRNTGETQFEIRRWMDEDHFYKKIVINDPGLEHPAEFTEQLKKFSLGDFTDMLSLQKMQVTEVFGDYKLNGYDVNNTPRMIILAKK